MSLRPEPLPPIPEATAAAVRAAFPKGNIYVDLRTEFGTLYEDQGSVAKTHFCGEIAK
jgi:transposase